jgi:23S rRNA (guanosine2251-2'-O)-methyltransferase
VVNLNRALDTLKQEGYRVVGLAAEGTVSLEEADLAGPLVIVTGSEGDGLSMLTRRNCDQLVRIPLRGATPSLNASVATALLLYEVARRGWMKGLSGSQPAPRLVRPQLPAPAASPEPEDEPTSQPDSSPELLHEQEPQLEQEVMPEIEPEDQPELLAEQQIAAATPVNQEPVNQEPLNQEPVIDLGMEPAAKSGFLGDIQL